MTSRAEHQYEIRRYLLGEASVEIQRQVEERLLTEDSFYEELLLCEEELIDDYVSGRLSGADRQRFEQHFLSTPERHQKLQFARALSRYLSDAEERTGQTSAKAPLHAGPAEPTWAGRFRVLWSSRTWAMRATLALALIAVFAGVLWYARPRTPSPRTFATLTLHTSAGNRAEGAQAGKVNFPLNADALRILLVLPEGTDVAPRYRAELEDEKGETKPLDVVGQNAQSVSVEVPGAHLTRGQYALKLFKTNTDGTEQRIGGSYFFIVE